jgi:hypothetical protein
MKRNTAPRMLATITPMSWPLDNPLDEALVGVDDVVDVDEGDVDDAEDDKDIEEDDVDDVDEGIAVEEGVAEVRVRLDDVKVEGIAEVVVSVMESDVDVGLVIDEGGIAETVVTGVEAGDVRPPYVQSEFSGICGEKRRYEKSSEKLNAEVHVLKRPSIWPPGTANTHTWAIVGQWQVQNRRGSGGNPSSVCYDSRKGR